MLNQGEWCWGDAGYPMQDWLVILYKKPDKQLCENQQFNYHLSSMCIGSEHTIGLLKEHFQSLKELRIHIKNAQDLQYANLWIHCCIVLHAFCYGYEHNLWDEDFRIWGMDEGVGPSVEDDMEEISALALAQDEQIELVDSSQATESESVKLFHTQLKTKLFEEVVYM